MGGRSAGSAGRPRMDAFQSWQGGDRCAPQSPHADPGLISKQIGYLGAAISTSRIPPSVRDAATLRIPDKLNANLILDHPRKSARSGAVRKRDA
jgi:hypothetical protein